MIVDVLRLHQFRPMRLRKVREIHGLYRAVRKLPVLRVNKRLFRETR